MSSAPLLSLPIDRSRPAIARFQPARHLLELSAELTNSLRQLAQREGVTVFLVLLTAFQVVLSRWSRQEDVVVGAPKGPLGRVPHPLPLRVRVTGQVPFRELLEQVREAELTAERDLPGHPALQVMFAPRSPGIQEECGALFELAGFINEVDGGLQVDLSYATELFEGQTIERLAGYLQRVLEQVVADPQRRVGDLELLDRAERERLVVQWNRTALAYPQDRCLHELFSEQAARTPRAPAVVFEQDSLSYAELEARSNQLAHRLIERGVGPEVVVGLCLERSLELVIGLLGILKAGGAYLPLDPEYPPERLAFMLADTQAPVVVTASALTSRLPASGTGLLLLDQQTEALSSASTLPPVVGMQARNLAYVIYTSGSTGRPKGVMIAHSATSLLKWAHRSFTAEDLRCVVAGTSICFDLSVFELFVPLCCGGQVVLVRRPVEAARPSLAPSLLNTVPSAIAELLTSGGIADSVRVINLAGEPLQNNLVQRLYECTSVRQVCNLYGPTEYTTYSTYAFIARGATAGVPIGRPIANTKIYVVDETLELVPQGVVGELCIAGAGLARGYLRRAGLTAERFVANPYAEPGGRMYRTGDQVRWRADGELEFLGRLDEQVKLRGFRIELGEIEASLLSHPGVSQAAVLVREDVSGNRRLVAYVTGAGSPAGVPDASELRAHLKRSLPDYMVPQVFMQLESLPLTANGKLDRKALPAPEDRQTKERVAPRTPVETVLAQVWAEVLGLDRVGVHDNFFEGGGDSIRAMRLQFRLAGQGLGFDINRFFEFPTIAELAPRVEELRSSAQEGLAPILGIMRGPGPLPLSFAQERLWFLEQLEVTGPAYNMPYAFRLYGVLDVAALERSLTELVRRHESLRTRFEAVDGIGAQVIDPAAPMKLNLTDLSGLGSTLRDTGVKALIQDEAERRFDLVAHSGFRAALLRLSSEEHILLMTVHHIVFDGWSQGVLFEELSTLYEACVAGRSSPLAEPQVQYGDYAIWQRSWLQGEVLEEPLAYWRQRLAGAEPLLLPTDHPRPAVASFRGAIHSFGLPTELTAGLRDLARQEGVTLFMVLLTGFQAVMSRWSGQEDVVIGVPIAGRTQQETESLVGCFANTLALRMQVSGQVRFSELMSQMQEVALGAYGHQDLPFEKLVAALAPERDLSRQPIVQVLFALQNMAAQELHLGPLTVTPIPAEQRTAKFDLSLYINEVGQDLQADLNYATDLFEAATIERLGGHLQRLLQQVVADPQRRVGDLELLDRAERERLVVEWNRTALAYPQDRCLHELFSEQAARTPRAPAVVFEQDSLSYAELEARSNQLAHRLIERGVGPEVVVGLCLERSLELVIGLLGILKAGGAYLPLDPEYPPERLAFMLADTQAPVVVTASALTSRLPASGTGLLLLDQQTEALSSASTLPPVVGTQARNLAYVIYTSGSTGRPKGVMIAHSATSLLKWAHRSFTAEDLRCVVAGTSICFDLSVFELFVPLCCGGQVVLVRRPVEAARPSLAPSLLNTVPSAIAELLTSGGIADSVRVINLAGEPLQNNLVQRLYECTSVRQVCNLYGPTEYTTYSTYAFIARGATAGVPIGRPIANTKIYVVDETLELVPQGVVGELCIAGAGLARGYLRRAGLTAERFVANPYAEPGGRMYRTGDQVRWRADGELEFLGRLDEQVKLRGFRIELGEIEASLLSHPGVSQAAVLVREDVSGNRRLVAYVTGAGSPAGVPDASELRAHLKRSLPDYMVPQVFMQLESLPLTANGKLDRKALPTPGGRQTKVAYVAARTPPEATLAQIWAEVLGLERVGIHDNFFELGGDSIQSIQIAARARGVGIQVSVRQIFDHQTVADLAGVVRSVAPVLVEQVPVEGDAPLTPIQRWFLDEAPSEPHHFNQSFLLKCRERLSGEVLRQALEHLVHHHDALRLRYERTACGWQQRHVRPGLAMVEEVDLSGLTPAQREEALDRQGQVAQAGLELSAGPLVRAVLFELGAGEPQRLLWVIHHLVVDTVSWRILLEDLSRIFTALQAGTQPVLAARTSAFQSWGEHLQRYARSSELREQVGYWRAQLSGPVSGIPVDHPLGRNTVSVSRSIHVSLSALQTQALLQEVPRAYRTQINDALLTALAQSLAQWTGGDSWVIGLEGHGREELFPGVDLSRTVGWFTSLFPVRLQLEGGADIGTALKGIKEQMRSVPDRGLGYGVLRYLAGEEGLGWQPQVSFNYLGQLDQAVSPGGWFEFAPESAGAVHSESLRRGALIEVNGAVSDGRLQLRWSYSGELHDEATIVRLAESYMERLRELIAHCEESAGGFTASDFPLAYLKEAELERVVRQVGVAPRGIADIYRLSPLQRGLLFHTLYEPSSTVYVTTLSWRISGALDEKALAAAWSHAISRHEILRTAFVGHELAEPVQVVLREVPLGLRRLDWRPQESAEQARRLEELLESERQVGFDFARPPLMRLCLVRVGEAQWQLIWTSHHVLLDGWSIPVLLEEVLEAYRAYARGDSPQLAPTRPYREFIGWLQSQDRGRARAYWRERLAALEGPTPTGVDRAPSGATQEGVARYGEYVHDFGLELSALEEVSRQYKLTLNTLALGAWACVLSRYSGQWDVVFGVTVSGRPPELAQAESRVGLFINTLPLRVRVDAQRSVASWLAQVQVWQNELLEYQYTPLVEVRACSELAAAGTELFESNFAFENFPVLAQTGEADALGGRWSLSDMRVTERSHYPLTLQFSAQGRLRVKLTYFKDRFEVPVIERLAAHLQRVLEQVVADPQRRVGDLELLDRAERERLVVEWNRTALAYPQDRCLHELFSEQAARTPRAPAVVFEQDSLSYAELEARSNQLAHRLIERGVGPEVVVGLCLERSLELVIGLLGILKAGGAYLPLDPEYPPERLAFMLADTQAPVVVTASALTSRLPASGTGLLLLDQQTEALSSASTLPPVVGTQARNLAYVIYTSGSTGRPKGVMIAHSATSLLKWAHRSFTAEDLRCVVAGTSICFDLSVFELFVPLCCGGQVVLVRRPVEAARPSLAPSLLNTVPSAIAELLTSGGIADSVRVINLAGEPLQNNLVQRLYECTSVRQVCNLYGPTEYTTYSTYAFIARGATAGVPIGRPIANTKIYVVDETLELVPQGVVGELCIAGAGLARGYLRRAGLTAERFVANPYAEPGGRMYRTGDQVRWRADGELEFLGRLDEQVKLRGFRIELGEIEASLLSHPGVSQAAVLVREDVSGNRRLVAYVTGAGSPGGVPDASELRAHLKRSLPDYMVPQVFMQLESLPLTPNGKLDRKALPAPEGRPTNTDYVAPRTPVETLLVQVWTEVLGVDKVGVYDDFFDLGGHSLLATRVSARLREMLAIEVPVRILFEARTIEELSEKIYASILEKVA